MGSDAKRYKGRGLVVRFVLYVFVDANELALKSSPPYKPYKLAVAALMLVY